MIDNFNADKQNNCGGNFAQENKQENKQDSTQNTQENTKNKKVYTNKRRYFNRFRRNNRIVVKSTLKPLTELKKGTTAKLIHFSSLSEKEIRFIASRGLHKGAVLTRTNSNTPIIVEVSGTKIALGEDMAQHIMVATKQKVIFLMGNPNVGKSTIFSRLTGVKTEASNYPGTTVSLLNGEMEVNGTNYTIYDMPGIYSLQDPPTKCEEESCNLIKHSPYDIAVYVADAEHLERNLFLALEIMTLKKPFILLLNKYDRATKKGINIDVKKLSEMLGVPVVACVGQTGKGLKELSALIDKISRGQIVVDLPHIPQSDEGKWQFIGRISRTSQKIVHRHQTILEWLEESASTLWFGLPMALLTLVLSFCFISFVGKHIINFLEPLYQIYYLPFIDGIFANSSDFLRAILIGGMGNSDFGILTDALKIAFIDVMPYVFVFYLVLEFLSDLGYLPRIAILLDKFLHKVGLHGYGIIPIMLGFGCKVPAIMGARTLETKRQKIIALALIFLSVPCISQTTIMFSVVAPYGIKYLAIIFIYMLFIGILTGYVLNKLLPGDTTDIFMEVPSWQIPRLRVLIKKVWQPVKDYIYEAVPMIILGVLLISLANYFGLLNILESVFKEPLSVVLGLPQETTSAVLLGFLRKDVSIALLTPFNLTPSQIVTACVFMAMYLPCTASLFVLLKEMGLRDSAKVIGLTFSIACVAGFILKIVL